MLNLVRPHVLMTELNVGLCATMRFHKEYESRDVCDAVYRLTELAIASGNEKALGPRFADRTQTQVKQP